MPQVTAIVAVATLSCLPLHAAGPGNAMKIREGAYADTLDNAGTVCVTKKAIETLSLQGWKAKMGQLGRNCSLTEPSQQSFLNEHWKAACSAAGEATKNNYRINLSFMENKLTIDSMIESAAGELKLKKAFQGEYKGACTSAMPALDSMSYLDLPPPPSASELKARKVVAADMIRCGTIFRGLSLSVAKDKSAAMIATGDAMWESALGLIDNDNDNDFYMSELKKSAAEISTLLIPLPSAEKRFQLAQACNKYLTAEGIANAVKEQTALPQK